MFCLRLLLLTALVFAFFSEKSLVEGDTAASLDLLFIGHDAGECTFFKPVLDELLLSRSPHYNVSILTLGEPATSIFMNYSQAVTLEALGVYIDVQDGTSDRSQLLTESDIDVLVAQLQPRVVVEGMVYQMQAQLGAAFKASGSGSSSSPGKDPGDVKDVHVVGIFDSFALWDPSSMASVYFVEVGVPVSSCLYAHSCRLPPRHHHDATLLN